MIDGPGYAPRMSSFGTHVVPAEGALGLVLGALEVSVEARADEWRLGHRWTDERDRDEAAALPAPIATNLRRVAVDARDRTIVVEPALPDGEVVIRTEPAISVLPGARFSLHVGTPVVAALRTSRKETLAELCCVRLERTWFGPNVRDGEVCLALRTQARLALAELPRRPHRAVTVLAVRNDGPTPFSLERLRLPMPHLSLFRAPDGRFWTEAVQVALGADGARISVGEVPSAAGAATRVVGPRRIGSPSTVLRALDALFSERW